MSTLNNAEYQPIPEYYADKTLLITGGSGFLGKVLLEKILRSCPDVACVYLLIRAKRGVSVENRLKGMLNSRLFDTLRRTRPDFAQQVVALPAELQQPDFGLGPDDVALLQRRVQLVFHVAATVRFDESLKLAVEVNVAACQRLLQLARGISQLEALVHVSTAYANCDRGHIEELVYTPALLPQKLLDAAEWMDDDVMEQLTPRLLGQLPNTYTYTKKAAEFLMAEACAPRGTDPGLPLVIVRPSIIGGTWQEPVPGWVDNFAGPAGLLAAAGVGLLRSMRGDREATADLIPADLVANAMLAVAWRRGSRPAEARLRVYNCVSGNTNRISWGEFQRLIKEYMTKNPLDHVYRLPDPRLTKSPLWHAVKQIFDQQLPCLFIDFWMYATGRKAQFCRNSNQLSRNMRSLDFFTNSQWEFAGANMTQLQALLAPADRREFNLDLRRLNWRQYVESYCLGLKNFVLKEDVSDLTPARSRIRELRRLTFLFKLALGVLAWRLAVKRVKVAQTLWYVMLNLASSLFQRVPRFARS